MIPTAIIEHEIRGLIAVSHTYSGLVPAASDPHQLGRIHTQGPVDTCEMTYHIS